VGVLHQIEKVATRETTYVRPNGIPFKALVPLPEIIADALSRKVESQAVQHEYEKILSLLGPELKILLEASAQDLHSALSPRIAEGILKVRNQEVEIEPGYDGVYGKVKILNRKTDVSLQAELF
jgi:PHP family Zn ribbon phosphoesterase